MGTYALSAGYYDAYYKRAQQVYLSCFFVSIFTKILLFCILFLPFLLLSSNICFSLGFPKKILHISLPINIMRNVAYVFAFWAEDLICLLLLKGSDLPTS